MFTDGHNQPRDAREDSISQTGKLEEALWELGRVSQSSRTLGWKEARGCYCDALYLLSERIEIPAVLVERLDAPTIAFIGGDEHINLRVRADDYRVYKITKADSFGCCVYFDKFDVELTGHHFLARGNDDPWFYLERWRLLNTLSDNETRLEGIIAPEREGWLPRL